MKNKLIILVLIVLFTISLSCGVLGYFKSKENNNPNIPIQKEIVTYNYFLEEEKVTEMPKNTSTTDENGNEVKNILYTFSKYICTNGIKGSFNNDKWEFIPENNLKGSCDLYFVKAKYDISLSVSNGVADEKNLTQIDRENDGNFIITPNEGYEFKEAICSNDKKATWDESTNTLSLSAIMYDVACTVKFEKRNLRIDVSVTNGLGNTTESVFYGDSKSIVVEPKDGYGITNTSINCTNNQVATYDNNSINFEKVTNNTVCKIKFQKIPVVTYDLIIQNPNENANVSISNGNEKQSVVSGKDAKITLKTEDGTTPTLNCGVVPSTEKVLVDTETTKEVEFTFYSVANNITCKIGSK